MGQHREARGLFNVAKKTLIGELQSDEDLRQMIMWRSRLTELCTPESEVEGVAGFLKKGQVWVIRQVTDKMLVDGCAGTKFAFPEDKAEKLSEAKEVMVSYPAKFLTVPEEVDGEYVRKDFLQ